MIISEMTMCAARTKYDKLFTLFDEFSAAIAGINDPSVQQFCAAWISSKKVYAEAIESGVRKSTITAGMEQGLREMPVIFMQLNDVQRTEVMNALRAAVVDNFPEFYEKDALLLASIIRRAKIRNEREYYLVRYRIDELEGRPEGVGELGSLYQLVEKFES